MPSERMSSDTNTPLLDADARRRFLIESCDVRGDLVRLGQSRREATANTDYPPVIDRLLGEAFVSAVLLAGTIKFDGRMTFQVRGDGAIHLLVVQVAADASYRGLARWSHVPADAIAAYFRSSEQLPTELTLEVDSEAASGLLLQRVPAAADPESADEGWARATLLAGTLESRPMGC